MKTNKMKPLFMWAGGKSKMIKHYSAHFPKNFDVYIEPFFGGGAMFLQALDLNPKAKFVINDVNEAIINIYRSIRNDCHHFMTRMDNLSSDYLPLSKQDRKKFYYDLRDEHAFDYQKWTKTEEAATLYFLMKTGFNGIWQINKNTNDRFGTPSGLLLEKTHVYDKKIVRMWHDVLQKTVITCDDFSSVQSHLDKNCWVFMDPPYRGGFTKYATDFNDDSQLQVVDFAANASNLNCEAWITNRDLGDDFFENYISLKQYSMQIYEFDVTYTAGRRKKTENGFEAKKAKELLIISK